MNAKQNFHFWATSSSVAPPLLHHSFHYGSVWCSPLPRISLKRESSALKLRRGSVIIYVLFIILVAMVIAMAVTTIMFRNVQVATSYSQSARSLYAAESGIERGLYYLQWARAAKTIGVQTTTARIDQFIGTMSFGATYAVDAVVDDSDYSTSLGVSETQQWDIFGEDDTSGYRLTPLPDLTTLVVSWNEGPDCIANTIVSQIEVSFSSWTQYQWEDISNPNTTTTRFKYVCPGAIEDTACLSAPLGVDDSHLYKVRVKALNCSLTDVKVMALDSTEESLATYNVVDLTSRGTFAHTQRVAKARSLWRAPIQQYFDFVLFSEDPITK